MDRDANSYRAPTSAGDLAHSVGAGLGGVAAATATFVRGVAASAIQVSQASANVARTRSLPAPRADESGRQQELISGQPNLVDQFFVGMAW